MKNGGMSDPKAIDTRQRELLGAARAGNRWGQMPE